MVEGRNFVMRWSGFVAAMWLMIFSGSYGFANYSTALKTVMGISQAQLNRLSVAKDLGDSLGVVAGILSNHLPPSALLCIGATVALFGYGVLFLVISQTIQPLPYWMMFLVSMTAGNAISWMNASVFTVAVRNFPRNRGPVVGLFKAYMGLSAALYSNLCERFFESSSSMFVLMLLVLVPSFTLATALFFRTVPPSGTEREERLERRAVAAFTAIAVCLALYIILQAFVPALTDNPILQNLLFVLLAAPAAVPFFLYFQTRSLASRDNHDDHHQVHAHPADQGVKPKLIGNATSNGVPESRPDHEKNDNIDRGTRRAGPYAESSDLEKPFLDNDNGDGKERNGNAFTSDLSYSKSRGCCCCPMISCAHELSLVSRGLGEDISTLSLLKTWHYYVLYFALFCGAGSGMAFVNNLGQVAQSFGYSTTTTFTSLFSLGNFMGRILSGYVSEYTIRRFGVPRPTWMGVSKLPMIAMFLWLATGKLGGSLYVGSFFVGLCHGSLISLTIPTVSELYGLKFFGTNFMLTNTHLLAGSSILSGVLAGYLYDLHASSDTLVCYGSDCFGTTFFIYASLLTFALFLDALIAFLSRPLYRKVQNFIINFIDRMPS